MIALRLFTADDPGRQLDLRRLSEGEMMTIGRDASAGWPLADADRALSRLHFTVASRAGEALVTDTSTNGVALSGRGVRLEKNTPTVVDFGERLEFGSYVLLIERADASAHVRPPPAARPVDANPFAPQGTFKGALQADDEVSLRPARRSAPFAAGLPDDPLTPSSSFDGGNGDDFSAEPDPLLGGDAWSARPDRQDWDHGAARGGGPAARIGAPSAWSEPPPAPADDSLGFDAPFSRPLLKPAPVSAEDLAIPADWDAPAPPPPPERPDEAFAGPSTASPPSTPAPPTPPALTMNTALHGGSAPPTSGAGGSPDALQAFCAAAGLDAALFAGEGAAAAGARLGAVYRRMVLGLSDVMGERTALRSEYRMVRTSVRPSDNNPFKFSPPQRVAADLLRPAEDGFLAGPQAVDEAFTDVKKHLLCMLAGLRAALESALDQLSPERIEHQLKDQPFALKTRAGAAWGEYVKAHQELKAQAQDNPDSAINREFRAAYEAQLSELDRLSVR